ncbi:MAG: MltA domain-containing protein [Desulfoarculaceae bacterium]|nr:MltA domain-containing protein [Desulfoarculaceae bacterium]
MKTAPHASHSPSLARRTVFFVLLCLWWPALGDAQDTALLAAQQNRLPSLRDDMDHKSLTTAATRHLRYLKTLSPDTVVRLENELCSRDCLLQSMATFLEILEQGPSPTELDQAIRENFNLYQAAGRDKGEKGEMLITGYYEPLLEGSLIKSAPFIHPLYSIPDSLISYRDPGTGRKTTGRQDSTGAKVPFWSRAEIEERELLAGNELVYLQDPVDAFVLHVQGSGKIRFQDGSLRAIQFAATNGRDYKSIGKLLVDEKKMTREEATMPSIRHYLEKNPGEQKRILHHNPRFVFFQWNKRKESPTGSLGLPLTAGRSIAIDPATLPTGLMAYLVSQKPVLDREGLLLHWEPMQRFVLPQDAGAAIKGAGRADLFWGNGHYAETAAGNMKEQGQLYFLVKKDATTNTQDTLASQLPGLR